ncbi:hypothetical protein EMIT0P12_20123 [Pseudomonas sp. IT-P12]
MAVDISVDQCGSDDCYGSEAVVMNVRFWLWLPLLSVRFRPRVGRNVRHISPRSARAECPEYTIEYQAFAILGVKE